jgi:hypothetical protein
VPQFELLDDSPPQPPQLEPSQPPPQELHPLHPWPKCAHAGVAAMATSTTTAGTRLKKRRIINRSSNILKLKVSQSPTSAGITTHPNATENNDCTVRKAYGA